MARRPLTCLGMAGDTAAVSSLGLSLIFPKGQHMLSSQPNGRFLAQSRCGWAIWVFSSSLGTMLSVIVLYYWLVGALRGKNTKDAFVITSRATKGLERGRPAPASCKRGAQASGFQ